MKSIYRILFTFILFIPVSVSAQTINDAVRLTFPGLGSSARALGMGNSYIGLSDDASASFYNPAGLGLLKKLEISGGLDYSNFSNNTTYLNTLTEHSNSNTRLNRLSFIFPFPTYRGSMVFGLSYHSVSDLTGALKFEGFNSDNSIVQDLVTYAPDITYDLYLSDEFDRPLIDGGLQQSGDVLRSGSINNWTLSGAVEVYRNIFIGGNLNIISGSFNSSTDYFEDDINNKFPGLIDPSDSTSPTNFLAFEENRLLDWDISGWDAKIGMLYQFHPQVRFGATIQFPKFYNIKETFSYTATSVFADDEITTGYDDEVEYDVQTPFAFSAGFSANLKGLIVSAEATVTDYTQTEFDNGEGIDAQYFASVNKNIKENLRSVINYNVGLEYTIPNVGLRLRTGYFVQPSAYDGDASVYDRKFLTAGLGFLVDNAFGFDLGYAYGWWEDFGYNYNFENTRTAQEITFNKFILTTTFRF